MKSHEQTSNLPAWIFMASSLVLIVLPQAARAEDAGAADKAGVTVLEDAAPTTISLSTEITGDAPTIYNVGTSSGGTALITGASSISYQPAENFYGTEYVTYDVRSTDASTGDISVDQGVITISVTSVNDPPTTLDDSATIDEDSAQVSINVVSNDSDDDTVTSSLVVTAVTIVSGDTQASETLSFSGGNVLYTPSTDYNGVTTIRYTVGDTHTPQATTQALLTVNVTSINDAPVNTSTIANPQTYQATEDTESQIDMSAYISDVESDQVVISSVTYTGLGEVSITGDDLVITYNPAADFRDTEDIYFTASDVNGGVVSGHLIVDVQPVQDAPIAVADSATVLEDSSNNVIDVKLNDTDDDNTYAELQISGEAITDTVASGIVDTSGSVSIVNQKISYTPAANFFGTETIEYTLTDTDGLVSTGTVLVTVTNANDGPTAVDDVATTAANSSVTINVLDNDSDVEGDTLAIASVTPPENGSAAISGTSIIYTPNSDFSGTDSFTYQSTDTTGETSEATVTITVTVANVGSCSTSASTLAAVANGCSITPSSFRTNVFAFGLCSAAPVRPGIGSSYDLSNCQLMYDGRSGTGTAITFGALNTSYVFPEFTTPANGSYTHGVLILGNTFEAKGLLALTGTNCVTTATTPFIACAPSYTESDAVFTPASSIDYFYSTGTHSYTFTSDAVTADLIDANQELITADGNGTQILAIQQFGSAKTVSDATRTIDIGFRVSQALTINSSAATTAPFSIRFEVQ